MYDYNDPSDFEEEYVHVDDVPDLSEARIRLGIILECLYGKRKLSEMEEHLDELCAHLGMKNTYQELAVREKANEFFELGAFLSTVNSF